MPGDHEKNNRTLNHAQITAKVMTRNGLRVLLFFFFHFTSKHWSALSPYLFALVMDEVTRNIQGDIPWCMLFADDVVLVDESQAGVKGN